MNMLNCENNCNIDYSINPKFIPKNFNTDNVWKSCMDDCREQPCKDVREGRYEFTGPKSIRSLCDVAIKCGVLDDGTFDKNSQFKKSFAVYEVSTTQGCDRVVNAVWRDPNHLTTINCAGDYYVKYTWDNCFENEPKFEVRDVCCNPCD